MTAFKTHFRYLRQDIPAGLVVYLVALPLCLGIALASGAPLFSGIITGIVGGVVVALLSQSQLSVSGPAAGLTVIVLDAITDLGSFEAFLVAVVLAGVLQIGLGLVRAGIIGMFFPSSVIRGMLAAIGLILILKQIPYFLGLGADAFGQVSFFPIDGANPFNELYYAVQRVDLGALLVGVVSLIVLVVWEPFVKARPALRLIPGALVVVVLSILLNLGFAQFFPALAIGEAHLVNLPLLRDAAAVSESFRLPNLEALSNPTVYVTAFAIAIVASLETLLSVEAVDRLDPHKRRSPRNRELVAQGVGNVVSGAIGGLPMTAVIVRSSANVAAGGQTKMSAFFHGVFLLLSVFLIPGVLNLIPLSALAAVLFLVGYKLTKPSIYREQFQIGTEQVIPFLVTVAAILLTDLLIGIFVGLAVGVFFVLRANYRVPYFYHIDRHHGREEIEIHLSEHVSFLNKASLQLMLERLPSDSHVTIDGEGAKKIDYDAYEIIEDFRQQAPARNIRLRTANIPEPGKDQALDRQRVY